MHLKDLINKKNRIYLKPNTNLPFKRIKKTKKSPFWQIHKKFFFKVITDSTLKITKTEIEAK